MKQREIQVASAIPENRVVATTLFYGAENKSTEREKLMKVVKRDGKQVDFNSERIINAISLAENVTNVEVPAEFKAEISEKIEKTAAEKIHVEEIQNIVEEYLMKSYPEVAKKYILYREKRTLEREKKSDLVKTYNEIVNIEDTDIKNENANMNGNTPAGQMMKFASEVAKDYTHKFLLKEEFSRAHKDGLIHIHDLDYMPSKTLTCVQYDLEEIFKDGFDTRNGHMREPQSISTYAELAAIIFQTNQNEMHGGQAVPALDFFLAPGVLKSYKKYFAKSIVSNIDFALDQELDKNEVKGCIDENVHSIETSEAELEILSKFVAEKVGDFELSRKVVFKAAKMAYADTKKETYQALEGFVHNLNTQHSRGGNQVVFSSVNYGTDTSPEGKMVVMGILDATERGLGQGETPIFPIQILKVKDGVSYSDEDFEKAVGDIEAAVNGQLEYKATNFDLFVRSCEVTSKRLFPNFLFLDTEFNENDVWDPSDPDRWKHEVATMGCRTRVFDNVNGDKTSIGRGNLSFTSMNLPRLAILARLDAEEKYTDKDEVEKYALEKFYSSIEETSKLVAEQLYERYLFQRTAVVKQFPFMLNNNIWKGGKDLGLNDRIDDIVKQGTLGIGFIGLAEALKMLIGEHHGESQRAQEIGLETVKIMNKISSDYKQRHSLNYAVLGTPAEGLSGRFTMIDKKKFGVIEGVNDKEYYTNSNHIPVHYSINAFEKIKREAPYHQLTLGGHITYIELDSEAKKNLIAVMKIVREMYRQGVGYGSINHPVDRCRECGYMGIIHEACPKCSGDNVSRTRRITGYLVGSLENWNSYKQAEERDRIKHSV